MKITVDVWRQSGPESSGAFDTYQIDDATVEMSLLELLDRLNDQLVESGNEPIAFDSDCEKGSAGPVASPSTTFPHGPVANTPTCRQHLRSFSDGDRIKLEPFRSAAFPVVRDLVVDRSALDRVLEAGGYVSVNAGTAPDADSQPLSHQSAEAALDFAACIGCGACVAACPNGAAHLFTGSKLTHLSLVTQGRNERGKRARAMSHQMEADFGPCSTYGECAQVRPAEIPLTAIAAVNKESMRFGLRRKDN